MINRILLVVLAAAIFAGAGGYTLASLNDKSFRLAEIGRDACYARHGVSLRVAASVPAPVMRECTQSVRDYQAGWPWRWVYAAAVGATAALLVVGGIVILLRRRRRSGH